MAIKTQAELQALLDLVLDPTYRKNINGSTLYSLLQDFNDTIDNVLTTAQAAGTSTTVALDIVGDGATTVFVVDHNLASFWVNVNIYTNSGSIGEVITFADATFVLTNDNQITVVFSIAPAIGEDYKVVVTG